MARTGPKGKAARPPIGRATRLSHPWGPEHDHAVLGVCWPIGEGFLRGLAGGLMGLEWPKIRACLFLSPVSFYPLSLLPLLFFPGSIGGGERKKPIVSTSTCGKWPIMRMDTKVFMADRCKSSQERRLLAVESSRKSVTGPKTATASDPRDRRRWAMEPIGVEPTTSSMRPRRSPN